MYKIRLNNTLSANKRDWIPCTIERGDVGHFGRPALFFDVDGVKLVYDRRKYISTAQDHKIKKQNFQFDLKIPC